MGRALAAVGAIALVVIGFLIGGAALPVTITGAFGIVTLLWTQSLQREAELLRQLSTERREMSKVYMGFLTDIINNPGDKKIVERLKPAMRKWSFDAMLLASDDALRAQARFIRIGPMNVDSKMSLAAIADVVLALRRDAVPRTKLSPKQVFGAIVNEPLDDEIFSAWEALKREMDL